MQTELVQFLNTLSAREKLFYILTTSYNEALIKMKQDQISIERKNAISKLYQESIRSILIETKSIYEEVEVRNENAEPPSIVPKNEVIDVFHDKLGPWASSFSSDSEDELIKIASSEEK